MANNNQTPRTHRPDGAARSACAPACADLFHHTAKHNGHRLQRKRKPNWPVIWRLALWFTIVIGLGLAMYGCAPTNDQWRVWNYELRDANYTLRHQLNTCIQPKGSK